MSKKSPAHDVQLDESILSPSGVQVLHILRASTVPVTRAAIAKVLDCEEQNVFRFLRDIRLAVQRSGYRLKTVRGTGYLLEKR